MLAKNKKGDITSKFIIGLVLVIIGFIILLFFITRSDWFSVIDKEACHNSVVYRSTFNLGPIEGSKIIPLKCKTEKICLTMSGDDCIEYGKGTRKNPVTKIKLNSDMIIARREIKDAFANSMVDCHSMLGEGKLNFMPTKTHSTNYGLICSRISFDQKTKEQITEDITYGEFYRYLNEKKTPNGNSYLEYLHPGWDSWSESENLFQVLKDDPDDKSLDNLGYNDWKIILNSDGGYAIITQVGKGGTWSTWTAGSLTAVAAVTGVLLVGTGVGAPVGITLLSVAGASGAAGFATGSAVFWYNYREGKYDYSPPAIFPYDIRTLQSLKITGFETAP